MSEWVCYVAGRWDGFGDWAAGAGAWCYGTGVGDGEEQDGEGEEEMHAGLRWL